MIFCIFTKLKVNKFTLFCFAVTKIDFVKLILKVSGTINLSVNINSGVKKF